MDLAPNGTARQQQVSLIRWVIHHLDPGRPECSFGGGSRPERREHSRAEPSMVRCASQTFPFSYLWVQWLRKQKEVMSILILSLVVIRELLLSMDI